jgi:toxin ParE1/3/4
MNRYTVGPKARRDLTEIYKYIARDSFSAADRVYEALLQTFCTLARHPLMGEAREDLAKNLRMFTSGKYVSSSPHSAAFASFASSILPEICWRYGGRDKGSQRDKTEKWVNTICLYTPLFYSLENSSDPFVAPVGMLPPKGRQDFVVGRGRGICSATTGGHGSVLDGPALVTLGTTSPVFPGLVVVAPAFGVASSGRRGDWGRSWAPNCGISETRTAVAQGVSGRAGRRGGQIGVRL